MPPRSSRVASSLAGTFGAGLASDAGKERRGDHAGYDGPITFESFCTAVVGDNLSMTLSIWRTLWEDGDDLGRQANAHIRGALRANQTPELHR